jgi:hypothetical protein
MDPLLIAARFAAFTCYLNTRTSEPGSPEDAGKYARENWKRFLPYVHQELGRLLTTASSSLGERSGYRPYRSARAHDENKPVSPRNSNKTAER